MSAASNGTLHDPWTAFASCERVLSPHLHHKLAPADRPVVRKLSEMTTDELEAAAQEAREEIEKLTGNEGVTVLLQYASPA
jgi:hypothetical protein